MVAGESPIGVFDSGLGGLTVMRSLIDLMPNESLVYIGDTARYPYGNKPAAQVRDYAVELATSLVHDHGAKLIVVACNTAAAVALDVLASTLPVPVIGVVEPGARALVRVTHNGKVGHWHCRHHRLGCLRQSSRAHCSRSRVVISGLPRVR